MKAVAKVMIRGQGHSWRVAESFEAGDSHLRRGGLTPEIEGDGEDGYHLVMSPEGCFTADTWHESLKDVKDAAQELFRVSPDGRDRGLLTNSRPRPFRKSSATRR